MEVVKVKTGDEKERYFVADDLGLPIEPILKFIRFNFSQCKVDFFTQTN